MEDLVDAVNTARFKFYLKYLFACLRVENVQIHGSMQYVCFSSVYIFRETKQMTINDNKHINMYVYCIIHNEPQSCLSRC